jgi:hypothetical protein
MSPNEPLLPGAPRVKSVSRDRPPDGELVLATRDHEIIREWARMFDAEPATGEATASGPASAMKVDDGGTGLRFNFPGVSRFRSISWDEWFDHFHHHDLTFVFDNPEECHPPSARYRLVRTDEVGRGGMD